MGHQGVDRNVVVLDVFVDLLERPIRQGVDLDHACIIEFDNVKITTLASLTAATASDNSSNAQFSIRTLGRLDLGDIVIEFLIGLPQLLAVLAVEVFYVLTALGLVGVNCETRVVVLDSLHKLVGLLECMKGIQVDEVDVRLNRAVEL